MAPTGNKQMDFTLHRYPINYVQE